MAITCADEKVKELYERQLATINTRLKEDIAMVHAKANKALDAACDRASQEMAKLHAQLQV